MYYTRLFLHKTKTEIEIPLFGWHRNECRDGWVAGDERKERSEIIKKYFDLGPFIIAMKKTKRHSLFTVIRPHCSKRSSAIIVIPFSFFSTIFFKYGNE